MNLQPIPIISFYLVVVGLRFEPIYFIVISALITYLFSRLYYIHFFPNDATLDHILRGMVQKLSDMLSFLHASDIFHHPANVVPSKYSPFN